MNIRKLIRIPWAPLTWIGHGAGSLAFTVVVMVAARLLALDPFFLLVFGTSAPLALYLHREEGDENAHKEAGDWRDGDAHGVTPMIDKYGDLYGPVMNALVWWAAYFVLRGW